MSSGDVALSALVESRLRYQLPFSIWNRFRELTEPSVFASGVAKQHVISQTRFKSRSVLFGLVHTRFFFL